MADDPIVLVAGVTGMLGGKLAAAVRARGGLRVRGLVRSGDGKSEVRQKLLADGVELVEGDLSDPLSLNRACQGVDAVVSTVQGGPDIILDGQRRLLEAALANGVRRFVPSDYSVNYLGLDEGDNDNLLLRKQMAQTVIASGIGYTLVLNGAFTEVVFGPFLKLFDFPGKSFHLWGDGDTPFETTTTDDTARYLAEALTDPAMDRASLRIAGTVLTMNELHSSYEKASGKTLRLERLGSVEDLKSSIDSRRMAGRPLMEYIADQYVYCMVSGKGRLDALDNDRYPGIRPETVDQFIRRAML